MPRILIGENMPASIAEWLKKKGLNAVRLSEIGLKGAKDHDIAKYAAKHHMTILTLDIDFAHIYYTLFRGVITVIVIKAQPPTPTNITETLNTALNKIKLEEHKRKLIIISKKRIRIIA